MKYNNKNSSLGELLLIFRRNLLESIKKDGLRDDLTMSQIEVLYFIGPTGKATMKNIADYLKITPPSATEIISDMEKKGLVKRHSSPSDRRVVYIGLSKTAKKFYSIISKRKEFIFKKMINKLNEADRKSLERIIRILIAN